VNSSLARRSSSTRLQSPRACAACQATWFDASALDIDPGWSKFQRTQAAGLKGFALWIGVFSFRLTTPVLCCPTGVVQLSSAPIRRLPAAGLHRLASRSRSRCKAARFAAVGARTAEAGAVRFPVEAPPPGGPSTPKPVDQPLHLRFQRSCVSAICGLSRFAVGSVFHHQLEIAGRQGSPSSVSGML